MAFQILSLSGGGYFGLYTATVLAEIESIIGAPIASRFDLIAGTSVGGIIALGLAAEVPAREIKAAFEKNGTSIFSARHVPKGRFARAIDLGRSAFQPKYDGQALRETIIQLVGAEAKIGSLKHPCIVPSVNLTKGAPQVFKTDHHENFRRDHLLKIVDVALATSAAPSYFPIAEIGDELFADGGLYANSPDLLALHEAETFFGVPSDSVRVLSVGTTTARFAFSHKPGVRLGFVDWASGQRLVRSMLSSQQMIVDFMLKHKLGNRYLRLDIHQSREQEEDLALDAANTDAQKTIRGLAEATIREAVGKPDLPEFLKHVAAPPVFHYRQPASA